MISILRAAGFATALIGATAAAQSIESLQVASSPLVLESVGSFFVGGRTVSLTDTEVGAYQGGAVIVDQMYVQYMIPQRHSKPAVVMIHGGTLSGKSYETTPDGRMGWYEYFARQGFRSYVVDQVGRARSGFNHAPFNDARARIAPPESQPNLRRVASDVAWVRFRVGPAAGVKFDDTQFPVEAAAELAKQAVPDLSHSLPRDDPNYIALAELARQLKDVILIGHSQAGRFPFETALLKPQGLKALISIEPAGCNSSEYSAEQIAALAKLPILVVFGDHLDTPQRSGPNWLTAFRDCETFISRVNDAKGTAKMLHPVELGIRGNSHMIMQDRNNLQIADLIVKWIDESRPSL